MASFAQCRHGAIAIRDQLEQSGFAAIRRAIPKQDAMRLSNDLERHFQLTPFGSGAFYGNRTKRFGRVLSRSTFAASLVQHPLILELAQAILLPFCDRIQINTMQAIEIHPGEPQQMPHRDDSMWRVPRGHMECLVNVMWPLTPFRAGNGATRFWAKQDVPAPGRLPDPDAAIVPEMDVGDALIFLGSTIHAGGANRSTAPRAGLVIGYSLGWLRQHENQYLAYPPEIARMFPQALARLLGYQIHRPNLGCFEGQCPSTTLFPERPEYFSATDIITPDQGQMLRAFSGANIESFSGANIEMAEVSISG